MNKDQANGLEVVAWKILGGLFGPDVTRREVIRDRAIHDGLEVIPLVTLSNAQAYAEQVRAETIEECAKVCDPYTHGAWFAKAIRALGEKK